LATGDTAEMIIFGVDPDPDVDLGSVTLGVWHFIYDIVTHQGVTLQWPWWSLCCLSALVVICIWSILTAAETPLSHC